MLLVRTRFCTLRKGSANNSDIIFNMKRMKYSSTRLQVYAFWTGFTSTIISLMHVIIVALKK